jgi:hypothetical protein
LRFWLRYIRHIRLAQQGVLRPSGDSGAMVGPVTCKPHTPRPVGSGGHEYSRDSSACTPAESDVSGRLYGGKVLFDAPDHLTELSNLVAHHSRHFSKDLHDEPAGRPPPSSSRLPSTASSCRGETRPR